MKKMVKANINFSFDHHDDGGHDLVHGGGCACRGERFNRRPENQQKRGTRINSQVQNHDQQQRSGCR